MGAKLVTFNLEHTNCWGM